MSGLSVKEHDKLTVERLHTQCSSSANLCSCGTSRRTFLRAARGSFVDARRSALAHVFPVRSIDAHVRLAETLPMVCSEVNEMVKGNDRHKHFNQYP